MSHTTDENDDRTVSKDQTDSSSMDETNGSFSGGGAVLKKGPWTSAEDAILVDYVKKHGEGNWNAVQKHSGLSRCGKSCRLRWANHLRPNLKKGAFTLEEEQSIIKLHAKMGNKWARMATHLPGRTDNEIKNYWNTRIKRRQRAGLPLYPPNVSSHTSNENQLNQSTSDLSVSDKCQNEVLQTNNFGIPEIYFHNLGADQGALFCSPPLPDISVSNMMGQSFISHNYGFINQHGPKQLHECDTLLPTFAGSSTVELPAFEQYSNGNSEKIYRPFSLSFPYDPDPGSKSSLPIGGNVPGSHAFINGNFSTSQSLVGAVKPELPSLQYTETDSASLFMCSPASPLAEAGTYAESPTSVSVQSECVSPRNSGLLEALLHESHAMNSGKIQRPVKSPSSSVAVTSDMIESSIRNPCNDDWEAYDPLSPLGCSAASVFSEFTPTGGSLFDDPTNGPPAGLLMKPESVELVSNINMEECEKPSPLDPLYFSRPDKLLGSAWCSDSRKDHSNFSGPVARLLGEEFCELKAPKPEITSPVPGYGLGSCSWNNMPPVCQISGLR